MPFKPVSLMYNGANPMAHGVKLDSLSMDDLKALIADAQAALAAQVDAKRQELQRQLAELDAISQPAKAAPSRQRAAPAPKYRSKANPDLTWAGRGGQPRWLTAEIEESGKKLQDFAV